MSEHDDKVLEVRELLAQNLGDPDFDAYVSGIGINSMEDFDTNSNSPEFVNHIHSILIEGAEPTPALSANIKRPRNPTFAPTINESMDEFQEKNASEPMDLAWRFLKQDEDRRLSPEPKYDYSEPVSLAMNEQIKGPCQMCGQTEGPYYDVGYRNPFRPQQDAIYTLCEACLDKFSNSLDTYAPYAKDIVLRAKRNMSPAARRHKLEYDTEYESSPERVKYREELNRERHRRGIYGKKNHMDVSHTEGGKLTLESEHDNRARHFKERGTLREVVKSNEFMENAFDMGYELTDYDDLHDKQRAIVDFISNKDEQHVPSYWTDPASGEYETEYYNGMFQPDEQHLYPDEAYDQYLQYLRYYFDEAKHTTTLPFEKQSFLMSGTEEATSHPEHPNNAALFRMAMEFPEWDVEDPHRAFYERYNSPEPQRGLASRMASGGFLRSQVLVKERGTLREVMKSTKEDLELLRNLLQGPMDEQDKKIGSAVVGMLNEREQMEGSDIHESPKHHDFFGGVHL